MDRFWKGVAVGMLLVVIVAAILAGYVWWDMGRTG